MKVLGLMEIVIFVINQFSPVDSLHFGILILVLGISDLERTFKCLDKYLMINGFIRIVEVKKEYFK